MVLASTISPSRIISRTAERGRLVTSMSSSLSRSWSATVRPLARKRWIRSSVNPGVV
jgi:hypothetical protein